MSHPVRLQEQVKQPELPMEVLGGKTSTHAHEEGSQSGQNFPPMCLLATYDSGEGGEKAVQHAEPCSVLCMDFLLSCSTYPQEFEQDES